MIFQPIVAVWGIGWGYHAFCRRSWAADCSCEIVGGILVVYMNSPWPYLFICLVIATIVVHVGIHIIRDANVEGRSVASGEAVKRGAYPTTLRMTVNAATWERAISLANFLQRWNFLVMLHGVPEIPVSLQVQPEFWACFQGIADCQS